MTISWRRRTSSAPAASGLSTWWWCALGACLVASLIVTPPNLSVTVEGSRIQFEPGYVRLKIRVQPDPANRALTVGIVSAEFETSSLEQLDGDRAPLTRWKEFRDIPAGEYVAIAEVYRPGADLWHAEDHIRILSNR